MILRGDPIHNGVPTDRRRGKWARPLGFALYDTTVASLFLLMMARGSMTPNLPPGVTEDDIRSMMQPEQKGRPHWHRFRSAALAGLAFVAGLFGSTMAQTWTLTPASYSGSLYARLAQRQLSDGTLVFLVQEGASYYLYYYTGSGTPSLIGQLSADFNTNGSSQNDPVLCVDASDNIYAVGSWNGGSGSTSNYLCAQGFVKGTGYSWTIEAVLAPTSGSSDITGVQEAAWCNTGGGTGSKGHILIAETTNTSTGSAPYPCQWLTLDAGVILAGTGTLLVSSATDSTVAAEGTNGLGISLSPNDSLGSVGATSGLVAFMAGGPNWGIYSWSVSSGGVITKTYVGTITTGGTASGAYGNTSRLVRVASGTWIFFSNSSVTSGHFGAWLCTTSTLGSCVDSGTPTNLPLNGGTTNVDFFNDHGTANQAWLVATGTLASGSLPVYELSCSVATGTPVWATTVTLADTLTSVTGTPPVGYSVRAITQSRVSRVDWMVDVYTGSSVLTLYGDNTTFISAPSAPTLTSPANASYIDVSSGASFTATYNSTDNYAQNAYALRIKTSGASSYSYWNASTSALQSTVVWNSDSVAVGASWTVTLPSGVLADGNIYNWSMASRESGANLQGSFASDFTFTAQAPPSVTVSLPTGTVTGTTQPEAQWADTLPPSVSQIAYSIIVETGTFGTSPGSGTQVWASGTVSSASLNAILGVGGSPSGYSFSPNVTTRCFVQVTESGGQTSNWGYTTFTIETNVPANPVFTGVAGTDPVTGAPMVTLSVQACDNELTANQASLESGTTTGWSAGSNTTPSASTAWAMDGSYSLAMTATASGAVSASTATGTSGIACTPGELKQIMACFHDPTAARATTLEISFYTSAGALVSTTTLTGAAATSGGAFIAGVVTVPATSAFYAVVLTGSGLNASEVLYADCILVAPARVSAIADANLVPDSDFRYALDTISLSDATEQGWNGPSVTYGGDFVITDQSVTYTSPGSVNAYIASPASAPIPVTPGQTMTISCDIDASSATAGTIQLAIFDTNISIGYFDLGQIAGQKGTVSSQWIVNAGVTEVRVILQANGVPSGETVTFSQPQLTATSSLQPYTEGPTWSAGGFVGSTTVSITFSDDAVYWYPVRNGTSVAIPADQLVTVIDYEGALGFSRHYQAQVTS